jgi:uncharacterized protein with PQ loop repeat
LRGIGIELQIEKSHFVMKNLSFNRCSFNLAMKMKSSKFHLKTLNIGTSTFLTTTNFLMKYFVKSVKCRKSQAMKIRRKKSLRAGFFIWCFHSIFLRDDKNEIYGKCDIIFIFSK